MTNDDPLAPVLPVDKNGHHLAVPLPDGRWLCLEPMTFQRARLCVTEVAGLTVEAALDQGWSYGEIWEFETVLDAVIACADRLRGREPTGWLRHHTRVTAVIAPAGADPRD